MSTVDERWAAVAEGVVTRRIRDCLPGLPISSPNLLARAILGDLADLGGQAWSEPEPRTWSLPAEPGPEVTALRDSAGDIWNRHNDRWCFTSGVTLAWVDLLFAWAPLTDATGEVTS